MKKEDLILLSDQASGMTILELLSLMDFVQKEKPKRILEIGTKHGRTTINLAKFSPIDAKIYSVDIKMLPKNEIKDLPEYNKIEFFEGNTLNFNFKKQGLNNFDLIFVDANHKEKYVINDTKIAYQLINPGGVIVWHDYNKDREYNKLEVTKALNKMNIKPNVINGTSLAWLRVS